MTFTNRYEIHEDFAKFPVMNVRFHLENAECYAEATGCITIFVCYRLAMKHPFPAGFNDAYDAYDALKWALPWWDLLSRPANTGMKFKLKLERARL